MPKIIVDDTAIKDLKKLEPKTVEKIFKFLKDLELDSSPLDKAMKLSGHKSSYRFRAGDYRILAEVIDDIHIFRIRHRKDVYKRL